MRLLCPNCSAVYEVPDAALAGRSRKLQCARCGTGWRSEPLSPGLAAVSDFAAAQETAGETQAAAYADVQRADADFADAQLADAPLAAAGVMSVPVSETDPALGLPMFLTSGGDDGVAPLHQPGQGDSFADLVHAARNNEVEYEPEKRPPPPVKISNLRLVLTLVLLLAAGLAGLAFLGHMT
ncbi:zinc-ribbon domain-containing protein [Acidocella sp.]|uniref:zinc-ribbon domain-containing protein n=1 Tax=Acidocella sp. TaxID=50710 RepID=UPI0017979E2C|nr:zinc-ribbon domain-containing protein [Acidocella sp.]NNM57391.1 hypothetical protein [Acidocella sp.]